MFLLQFYVIYDWYVNVKQTLLFLQQQYTKLILLLNHKIHGNIIRNFIFPLSLNNLIFSCKGIDHFRLDM
jgi:hypothetical protein